MRVDVSRKAQKDIEKLDNEVAKNILLAIKELESFPNSSNIKKLIKHDPPYRKRVGDYRLLFDVGSDTIEVGRVLHRREAYE